MMQVVASIDKRLRYMAQGFTVVVARMVAASAVWHEEGDKNESRGWSTGKIFETVEDHLCQPEDPDAGEDDGVPPAKGMDSVRQHWTAHCPATRSAGSGHRAKRTSKATSP